MTETIRQALVANMHDGDEGGRLTMNVRVLLDDTCEIIQEFVLDEEVKALVVAGKNAKALAIVAARLGGFPPDEDKT